MQLSISQISSQQKHSGILEYLERNTVIDLVVVLEISLPMKLPNGTQRRNKADVVSVATNIMLNMLTE